MWVGVRVGGGSEREEGVWVGVRVRGGSVSRRE